MTEKVAKLLALNAAVMTAILVLEITDMVLTIAFRVACR